jgi:hypothetical protein
MSYGDDKIKDMIESLLPSSRRKAAREGRAAAHRKERRATRQNHDRFQDHDRKRRIEIMENMWERRNADKLSFVRWAEGVTKHLSDPEDRYNYIKKLVPDNTIGRHALTHLPYEWQPEYRNYSRYRPSRAERQKNYERRDMADRLRALFSTHDGHRNLNGALKYGHNRMGHPKRSWLGPGYRNMGVVDIDYCDRCPQPRLLAGIHDIADFIEDIYGSHRHKEWQETVKKFLDME